MDKGKKYGKNGFQNNSSLKEYIYVFIYTEKVLQFKL